MCTSYKLQRIYLGATQKEIAGQLGLSCARLRQIEVGTSKPTDREKEMLTQVLTSAHESHFCASWVKKLVPRPVMPDSLRNILQSFPDMATGGQEPATEIVQGILRERQIGIFAGYYSVGKSPFVADFALHVVNGLPFLHRGVSCRPVTLLDFETPPAEYEQNINRICLRYKDHLLTRPQALLFLRSPGSLLGQELSLVVSGSWRERQPFLRALLRESPNALLIIDPAELFFTLNRNRAYHVQALFRRLRELLKEFPKAAFLLVFNLHRRRRRHERPSLLKSPLDWLEDVAGNLDLENRSDVRVGIDFHPSNPEGRVLNGVRRGEDMHALVIQQVGIPGELKGFELARPELLDVARAFSRQQRQYWHSMPNEFHFEDIADKSVPRASLSRLLERARSLGLLKSNEWVHRKT
jgi:hypothetical protein